MVDRAAIALSTSRGDGRPSAGTQTLWFSHPEKDRSRTSRPCHRVVAGRFPPPRRRADAGATPLKFESTTNRRKGSRMIFICATWQVKPENADQWLDLVNDFTEAT